MKTLFLNPPSFHGFDGGAGSRYQARREIRSFWYPTWLAQAAALVDDSRVLDAPADGVEIHDVLRVARDFDLVVIYTSTPSFASDARTAIRIKHIRPDTLIGLVGPHVSVLPEESLRAAPSVDFVVRREFDLAIRQIAAGMPLGSVRGVSWRDGDAIRHNLDSSPVTDLDSLPFVVDVYKRDLTIENYSIGYLMHPYLSLYTGRGCHARCTFCLWPQTMSGHRYRVRSAQSVYEELARAKQLFPQVREYFLDDDTFTADPRRAVEIGRKLGKLGVTWSTSSRANILYDTLKQLKECGLRLLMVGYESGCDDILKNVRKGITTQQARRFTQNCKSLGIATHGTFVLGLPGETRQTIEQTINFAREIDPDTIQVSIAAPYPGTEFHKQAVEHGWLTPSNLVSANGTQTCPLQYEDIGAGEISEAVDRFYKHFYFRPKVMLRIGGRMLRDGDERRRRLREGREFFTFLKRHGRNGHSNGNLLKRVLANGGPGFCQFAVTDACNAHCAFCNFSMDASPEGKRVYVDLEEARASLDVLAENGIEHLAFVGGEPTLHPHLPEMCAHAKTLGMKTIVCTNGSMLTPEMVHRHADAGLDIAIISIDASDAETHEQNRGLPGVCARIGEANTILREAGVSTTASVTISKLLGNTSALPALLESLGFDRVTFSYPLRRLGSGFRGYSHSKLLDYSDEDLHAAFEDIKRLKKRFRVANPTASIEEMQRFVRGERQRFPCLAGWKYFYLDWNLDLYRCHAWAEKMCSVFDFDGSQLVRDGCTRCMIDCYRDASVLHHVGAAMCDARSDLARGRVATAAARLLNRTTFEAAMALLEERGWISETTRSRC